MKRILACLFLLSCSFAKTADFANADGDLLKDPAARMVFYAVLEGLFMDGVSKEHAALMFSSEEKFSEHFVFNCPLCHPAVEAIRLFKVHPHFEFQKPMRWNTETQTPIYKHAFGNGLDDATAKRLESKDRNERIVVIQELIQKWVSKKLNSMRLTAEERVKWKTHLEMLRKRGMASLEHTQRLAPANIALKERKSCPACDGSTAACAIAAGPEVNNQPQSAEIFGEPDIFFAVLEELYRSGASSEDLTAILPGDRDQQRKTFTSHFVYSCELCHATWEAMRLYVHRPVFYARKDGASTFGKGMDPAISAQLRSPDAMKRMEGIQALVTLSVKNRMESLRLTHDEKQQWQTYLKKLRDKGTSTLQSFQKDAALGYDYSGWKRCPSCDGSAEACRVNLKPKAPPMGPEF